MRHHLANRTAAGFTIVEVILVLAIMSVVVLALLSFYIPVQRSTITQTQVADIQDNMRLAMDRITKDIFRAGFLIENFETTPPITDNDATGFTIQTRLVGDAFARVATAAGTELTLADPQMAALFTADADRNKASKVRIFDPLMAQEIEFAAQPDPDERLYNVDSIVVEPGPPAVAKMTVEDPGVGVPPEAVVVGVVSAGDPDPGPPPIQTIRYQFSNGSLLRTINGVQQQVLASGLDTANSSFAYKLVSGRVKRVDITLSGVTRAVSSAGQNDTVGSAKTRSLRSSVTIRNG